MIWLELGIGWVVMLLVFWMIVYGGARKPTPPPEPYDQLKREEEWRSRG
jgi:hypothetical protein